MSRDEKDEDPTPLEILSYTHVMLGELLKMVRPARDHQLNQALDTARQESEAALHRMAQSIVNAARGDAA